MMRILCRRTALRAWTALRARAAPRARAWLAPAVVVLLVPAGALPLFAASAAAHETVDVQGYDFDVGWGQEPAFAGELNSVQLTVTAKPGGEPVKGVDEGLRVTVIYGENELEPPLVPAYGTKGEYRAWFVPTAPGDYTFRFTGTIGDQEIDESFTSSSTTFDTVQDPVKLQFPVQTGTVGQLARRLDAELAPEPAVVDAAVETSGDGSGSLLLGVAGVVLGGLGLAVAALALLRTRS
ncbi:MAG TPA: hypothetical protein VLA35_08935 [Thermoleophilia bacterium]|nr:hypothetical protein [Thermoleophilia bacterium]